MKLFDKTKKTIKENKEIKKVTKEVVVSKKNVSEKLNYKDAYRILIRPINTEKTTNLAILNQYVFEVAKNANKVEIQKAIRAVYNVKPINVNIVIVKGKNVRYGKAKGKTKDWKKAIVSLKQGEKIENF
ncbi:MAG: 50S ribosomal protein L23 [Patescibacteria group bacterium]